MAKYNMKNDIRALRPLNWLAKYLALLPNFNNESYEHQGKNWYIILYAFALLSLAIFSSLKRLIAIKGKLLPTMFILSVLADISFLCNALAAIIRTLLNGKNICSFLKSLQEVDYELNRTKRFHPKHKYFRELYLLIISHILFFAYFAMNTYIWTSKIGINLYKHYFIREIELYHILVLSLLMKKYASTIRLRMETVNELLLDKNANRIFTSILMTVYIKLYSLTNLYNKIFGWQYICLYGMFVVNVLYGANMILIYGDESKHMLGLHIDYMLGTAIAFMAGIPMFIIIGLVNECTSGTDEFLRTSDICYELLYQKYDKNNYLYVELLQEFAVLSSTKCPQFLSAGYMPIAYSVIFSIVGSVASYIVILIQINNT